MAALWVHIGDELGPVWTQMRLCGRTSHPVVLSQAFLMQ